MADISEKLARRYPWSKFPRFRFAPFAKNDEREAALRAEPFIVRWTVPDPTHGLYGWATEQRHFASDADARSVAEAPMGVARSVELLVWDDRNGKLAPTTLYERKNARYGR